MGRFAVGGVFAELRSTKRSAPYFNIIMGTCCTHFYCELLYIVIFMLLLLNL